MVTIGSLILVTVSEKHFCDLTGVFLNTLYYATISIIHLIFALFGAFSS